MVNGNYVVVLHFAEIYWNGPGKRIFNVSMQGTQAISNLDIYSKVGKNAAYDVQVPVSVTNGTLEIDFSSVVDYAKCSAIEVISANTPVIASNAASLNFSAVAGGANPPDQSIVISNVGGGTLSWATVADKSCAVCHNKTTSYDNTIVCGSCHETTSQTWLSVSPGSGTGNAATLTVTANTAGLQAGTYNSAIAVTSSGGAANGTESTVTGVLIFQPVYVTLNVAPSDTAGLVSFATDSGGGQYTSQDGTIYQTDADFSGGQAASTTATITGTTDPVLYQTERYGNFSYQIPLPNGNYEVTLKFAEIYWNGTGQRIFNVSMQGTQVISNLDIYAKVGKNAAYDVTIPVSVTYGVLNIGFSTVVDNAKVSAIEVIGAGEDPVIALNTTSLNFGAIEGGANPADQTIAISNAGGETMSWTAIADSTDPAWLTVGPGGGTGNGTISASVKTAGLAVGTYTKTITIAAPGSLNTPQIVNVTLTVAPSGNIFAINAGGGQYTSASGVVYQADTDYSPSEAASTTATITGTTDPVLYQTERYGNFSYQIPLANGNYIVTLKFAEIYWNGTGQRIFNVSMQGTQVISNLDIYSKVGKNAAYDVQVPVTVTNGTLSIVFSSVVDFAKISAIQVSSAP